MDVATPTRLIAACHPLPSLAVSTFATALAFKAGVSAPVGVLVAVAVLAGQLSIGWGNDRLDLRRDRVAGRTDKPLAVGSLSTRSVDVSLVVASAAAVVVPIWLGWPAMVFAWTVLVCGWVYNLGFKAVVWSWLPYALAFGSLPALASTALDPPAAPRWWAVPAAAALGVGAHLVNALPDLADDLALGVRGLPQRLGPRRSLVLSGTLLVAGGVLVLLGPGLTLRRILGAVLLTSLTVLVGTIAWPRPTTRWVFVAVILLVAADVAVLFAGPGFVATG